MGRFSCLTFLLIAVSCYVLCSSKAITLESDQTAKKMDLPNRISAEPNTSLGQKEQQQFSHAIRDEARRKRSQSEYGSGVEYKDLNDIIEELEDNNVVPVPPQQQEYDFQNLTPLDLFLLFQHIKRVQKMKPRVLTPRLGRSIDFQLLDAVDGSEDSVGSGDGGGGGSISVPRQFVSRRIKKSVPFKPRLGKRTQMCY